MKYVFLSLVTITLFGCAKTEKKQQPFDSFVYSFSAQALEYSIQFGTGDTVYFIKRRPEPAGNSFAVLDTKQKDSLSSLVQKLDFKKYQSDYKDEAIMDASAFTLSKTKGGKKDAIHVYGTKAPKELYVYAAKLNEYIKRLDFKPYNGKVPKDE